MQAAAGESQVAFGHERDGVTIDAKAAERLRLAAELELQEPQSIEACISCAGSTADSPPATLPDKTCMLAEFEQRSWWQLLDDKQKGVLVQFVESLLSSDEDPEAVTAAIRAIACCPVRQRPSHARCPAHEARKSTPSNPAALPASGDPLLPLGARHVQ